MDDGIRGTGNSPLQVFIDRGQKVDYRGNLQKESATNSNPNVDQPAARQTLGNAARALTQGISQQLSSINERIAHFDKTLDIMKQELQVAKELHESMQMGDAPRSSNLQGALDSLYQDAMLTEEVEDPEVSLGNTYYSDSRDKAIAPVSLEAVERFIADKETKISDLQQHFEGLVTERNSIRSSLTEIRNGLKGVHDAAISNLDDARLLAEKLGERIRSDSPTALATHILTPRVRTLLS